MTFLITLLLSFNVMANDNLVQVSEDRYYDKKITILNYNPMEESEYILEGSKFTINLLGFVQYAYPPKEAYVLVDEMKYHYTYHACLGLMASNLLPEDTYGNCTAKTHIIFDYLKIKCNNNYSCGEVLTKVYNKVSDNDPFFRTSH